MAIMPLSHLVLAYFSTMALLYLMYSTAWKKISSLSALVSLLILPLVTWQLHGNQAEFAISLLLAFYIIVLHRSNIQRLLQGEEGKLTSKDT